MSASSSNEWQRTRLARGNVAAWEAGRAAYDDDKPESDCPYGISSIHESRRRAWLKGYAERKDYWEG